MKNCLLCSHCTMEGGYEEGYYGYSCWERELDNDDRFPYRNTKCKKFKQDESLISLSLKNIGKELWDLINWEVD